MWSGEFDQIGQFARGMYISNEYFVRKILTILHENSEYILKWVPVMFLSRQFSKAINLGPLLFVWSCKPQIDLGTGVWHAHYLAKY